MNIKEEAKLFAIKAHRGQRRKSAKELPMIIHPINVSQILEEYGYDDSVIAAGLLHDIVEDTNYTIEDIEKHFTKDIASLVHGASEPDKSLSWEIRKEHTINECKNLSLRHKVIICADKISNLEDLRNLSESSGEYKFNSFKRGFESQKWYYTEIYNSLITNEDKELPIFKRLKDLIDYIFYNIRDDDYIKNIIFENKTKEYRNLLKIHYQKEEIFKLRNVLSDKVPYVIEFTGTPRTGKTTLINNLSDFFKKKGFTVEILEEFTTSKQYKENIYPLLKDKYKNIVNTEIPKYVRKQLEEAISRNPDIIIVDRSLFDRLIWVDRLYQKKGMTENEYDEYKNKYLPLIKNNINIIISTYTDALTSLKRDYNANLSLEKRNFLNEQNILEYNESLINMRNLCKKENINLKFFNTTNKSERKISFEVIKAILKDMRKTFVNRVNKEFE